MVTIMRAVYNEYTHNVWGQLSFLHFYIILYARLEDPILREARYL